MSTLRSKQSSKGNLQILYTNQSKFSNRKKQKPEMSYSNQLSSAVGLKKNSKMQLTFQKTDQKVKKNLSKEFQTFNINNDETNNPRKKQGDEASFEKINQQKSAKPRTQAQMTTQAKSSLVKSNLSSKAKLSQYKQKQGESQKQIKRESTQKSREQRDRHKSPTPQVPRSCKQSPEVSPAYSKWSTSEKRVFAKSKLAQNQQNIQIKKKSKGFTKNVSRIEENVSMRKGKDESRVQKQISGSKGKQFQISFPHMITESQSVYPSSSYPNTGKQSQLQNHSAQDSQQNSNIDEQEEMNEEVEHSDYISEDKQYDNEMMDYGGRHQGMEQRQINQMGQISATGYQQLPKSYLLAMEILQSKVNEQQKTIQKLHKQLSKENKKYTQLEEHSRSLQQELEEKQNIIAERDAEIRFLKGYLEQQKQNNREALKEVAKNVYERTITAKKQNYQNIEALSLSQNKLKKQLFSQNRNDQIQKLDSGKAKQTFPSLQLVNNPYYPQLQRQIQMNQSLQRQQILKEQLLKQQLIKDEMMREQILREEALQNRGEKKFNYLGKSRSSQGLVSGKDSRIYTMKKSNELMKEEDNVEKVEQYGQLYTDGKRPRSISTAAKLTEQKNLTYRPRNTSSSYEIPRFGYTNALQSQTKTPLKQSLLVDPVLEKYIQAKSQISFHRFQKPQQSLNNNYPLINPNQGAELKNQRKNKETVSKMRQLMRAEKQLVALNYKLEAIQRRILQCVKSNSKDENTQQKSMHEQVTQKLLMEDMQKQYAVLKKEFEIKEVTVKEIKANLDLKI